MWCPMGETPLSHEVSMLCTMSFQMQELAVGSLAPHRLLAMLVSLRDHGVIKSSYGEEPWMQIEAIVTPHTTHT